ncbi:MAG: hypothetical protein WBK77_02540 [Alphaproteobacteria bacterium]
MQKLLLIAASIALYTNPALADCKVQNAIYTDGARYQLFVDPEQEYHPASFHIKMLDIKTKEEFLGDIVYNNGYSIPNVTINLPCPQDEKDSFCGYVGTVYTITKNSAEYGLNEQKNPILFPDMGFSFYHAWRFSKPYAPIPADVWQFMKCRQ